MRVRTLYRNGHVYVPTRGFPTALLVDGTRVLWIGTEAEAEGQAAVADRVVNLDGRLVTTPFVDPFVRADLMGDLLHGVPLEGTRSLTEALDRVALAPTAGPLVAEGYDEGRWPELRAPRPEELARAVQGRPALALRAGRSFGVASPSLVDACRRAGIDVRGWEAGLGRTQVHEALMTIARLHTDEERARRFTTVYRTAAAMGIGALHDFSANPPEPQPSASTRTDLPLVRSYVERLCPPHEDPAALARELGVDGVCVRLDGPAVIQRAALLTPYLDQPGWSGPPTFSAQEIADHLVVTSLAGVQTAQVCIGDRAASVLAEAMRLAVRTVGLDRFRSLHHRAITHLLGDVRVVGTFIDLGVRVTRIPQAAAVWGGSDGVLMRRLGPTRVREAQRLGTLFEEGLQISLTSAAPSTTFDPWATIRAARRHRSEDERIAVGQAFRAHASGGWLAARESHRGYLDVGLPADFVVWDVDPDELGEQQRDRLHTPGLPALEPGSPNPRAVLTVIGGRTIHSSEGALT